MSRRRYNHSGFTLIEVLIVFAIIGIIAAIAIPAMGFAIDRSRQMATMSDMRNLAGAVMQYYMDRSFYPSDSITTPQLTALVAAYAGDSLASEDRWAHEFGYVTDGKNAYTIESFGRDGLDGADIGYETRYDFNLDIVFDTTQFTRSPESYQ